MLRIVRATDGALSYNELMAMELGEYMTVIGELSKIDKPDSKTEKPGMSVEKQIQMIKTDPAIRKAE